jgi:hypothetical protein
VAEPGLGRRHQHCLAAHLDGVEHGQQRHQRLAAADVAHEQAEHRPGRGHVAEDRRDGGGLVCSGRVGKGSKQAGSKLAGRCDGAPALRFPPRPDQQQRQLAGQKLIVGKAPPRGPGGGRQGIDGVQQGGRLAPVGPALALQQGRLVPLGQLRQGPDGRGDQRAQARLGQSFGQRIGDDRRRRRTFGRHRQWLRVRQLPATAVPRQPAMEQHGGSGWKAAQRPVAADVEEDEVEGLAGGRGRYPQRRPAAVAGTVLADGAQQGGRLAFQIRGESQRRRGVKCSRRAVGDEVEDARCGIVEQAAQQAQQRWPHGRQLLERPEHGGQRLLARLGRCCGLG